MSKCNFNRYKYIILVVYYPKFIKRYAFMNIYDFLSYFQELEFIFFNLKCFVYLDFYDKEKFENLKIEIMDAPKF